MKYLITCLALVFIMHPSNAYAIKNTSPGGNCCGNSSVADKNGCLFWDGTTWSGPNGNNCLNTEICKDDEGPQQTSWAGAAPCANCKIGQCIPDQAIGQTGGSTGVRAGGNRECEDFQVPTAIGCINFQTGAFATQSIQIGIGIGSGIAFLMIIYGSYVTASSQGIPDGINKGKDIITSAIIGLVFIVLSVTTLQIIGFDILGLGQLGLGSR